MSDPEDVEELVVRTLFELNARTIETYDEIRAIRRLLATDETTRRMSWMGTGDDE